MKTISYYDLLKMIKEGKYPIVEYNNIKYIPDFDIVDGSFIDYQIGKKICEYNEKFYLVENLLECEMFNKVLTIVEQDTPKEDKKIEKLNWTMVDGYCIVGNMKDPDEARKVICQKIDEIIDKVNGE